MHDYSISRAIFSRKFEYFQGVTNQPSLFSKLTLDLPCLGHLFFYTKFSRQLRHFFHSQLPCVRHKKGSITRPRFNSFQHFSTNFLQTRIFQETKRISQVFLASIEQKTPCLFQIRHRL